MVTPPFTPPDEMDAWYVITGQELMHARLHGTAVDLTRRLVAAIVDDTSAYMVLLALAAPIAGVLRPEPYDGGPIGERVAQIAAGLPLELERARHAATAAQLIGAAARADAETAKALALAVARSTRPADHGRHIARAMLHILALEPTTTTRTTSTPGETA